MEYLTKENFTALAQGVRPLLVEFFDPGSGTCRLFAPGFAVLSEQLMGQVTAARCDIKAQPELAAQFSVMEVPTVLLLRNGREQIRIIGNHSAQVLRNRLRSHL